MNNPFYIKAANPGAPIMQGLGMAADVTNQRNQLAAQKEAAAAKEAEIGKLMDGIYAGDRQSALKLSAIDPKMSAEVRRVVGAYDEAELNNMNEFIAGLVGSGYSDEYLAKDHPFEIDDELRKQPQEMREVIARTFAAHTMQDDETYSRLFGAQGADDSVRIQEFNKWKSMPEGEEKKALGRIIGAVSRSESADDYIKRKQAEQDVKLGSAQDIKAAEKRGTSQEAREQGFIDAGIDAADSLSTMTNALGLLKSVDTGGIDNAMLRAKQLFGIESANEAELANELGVAVLQQLKPIFGSAFTAAEGDRLERLSAGFGKSRAGNIRILEKQMEIAERAGRRAIRAAKSKGDEFSANEIQMAMDKAGMDSGEPEGATETNVVAGPNGVAAEETTVQAPMTATGPNGQKLQLINGQWVPM